MHLLLVPALLREKQGVRVFMPLYWQKTSTIVPFGCLLHSNRPDFLGPRNLCHP